MPELPEVETVVRTVRPYLIGRRLVRAQFTSRLVTPGDHAQLSAHLKDQTIVGIRRYGKFILIELERGYLSVHLGMTGRLLYNAPVTKHTRAMFQLDWGMLLYDDIRQFGRIEWAPALPSRAGRLGPDPFEISAPEFVARLERRAGRVKPLLLNQRFLRGLGNIYVDECLFRARIHPLTLVRRLSKARAKSLHQEMQVVLSQAIDAGGSSISDYVDADGQRGGFQDKHAVYGREGKPCFACGSPIQRIVVSQRGTHFCKACQKR